MFFEIVRVVERVYNTYTRREILHKCLSFLLLDTAPAASVYTRLGYVR